MTTHPTGAETPRTQLETMEEVRRCAAAWDPEARLLGNVRAGDIVSALARLTERNRALEARNVALEGLLACYRLGTRPSEKLLRQLDETRRALTDTEASHE